MRKDKEQAIHLRLMGKSYGEICKALNLPSKGTLSVWFRDLKLTTEAKQRLAKNKELAWKRGLTTFNQNRTEQIQKENKQLFDDGAGAIKHLSQREIFLIAVALYWGEGTKSIGDGRSIMAVLTNADPLMIQFYLRFLREIINVKEEKIRAQIIIHDNASLSKAKRYWQQVTNVDPSAISTTVQVSQASKRLRSKKSIPYGTLQIRVHDRRLFYKIKGMIHGVANQV